MRQSYKRPSEPANLGSHTRSHDSGLPDQFQIQKIYCPRTTITHEGPLYKAGSINYIIHQMPCFHWGWSHIFGTIKLGVRSMNGGWDPSPNFKRTWPNMENPLWWQWHGFSHENILKPLFLGNFPVRFGGGPGGPKMEVCPNHSKLGHFSIETHGFVFFHVKT